MSQGAVIIPTTPPLAGATLVGDVNTALAVLSSHSSGNVAPTLGPGAAGALVEGQFWVDTSVNPSVIRQYRNASWVPVNRIILTANLTIFVDVTNGNDGNSGLAPGVGNALKTPQAAFNLISSRIDVAGFIVTIQLADGTYPNGIDFSGGTVGAGSIVVQGNTGAMDNVVINSSSTCFQCFNAISSAINLRFMKLTTSGAGFRCLDFEGALTVNFRSIDFGATNTGGHILLTNHAFVTATGAYTISGASGGFITTFTGAVFSSEGVTITVTGTPAITTFASASRQSLIDFQTATFSGSATGTRYSVNQQSAILTNGGGATFLPGNVAGSVDATTYGIYT